jgi:hypothetical protein
MKRHIFTAGIRPKIKIEINIYNAIAICICIGVIITYSGLCKIAVLGFQEIDGGSKNQKCEYDKNPFHNRRFKVKNFIYSSFLPHRSYFQRTARKNLNT